MEGNKSYENVKSQKVKKLLEIFKKNGIYFTVFGNTEYPGTITYDQETGNFVFTTEREGM